MKVRVFVVFLSVLLTACFSTNQKSYNFANSILIIPAPGMQMEPPGPENGPINEFERGFINNLYSFYDRNYPLQGGYIRTWTASNPVRQIAIEDFVFSDVNSAQSAFNASEAALKNVSGSFVLKKQLSLKYFFSSISVKLESIENRQTIYALQSVFVCKNAIYIIQMQSLNDIYKPADLKELTLKQYTLGNKVLYVVAGVNYFGVVAVGGVLAIVVTLIPLVWWWGPPRKKKDIYLIKYSKLTKAN